MYRVLYWISRLYQPKSRADELLRIRSYISSLPKRSRLSAKERNLAEKLRRLRIQVPEELGKVRSCATCAKGYPPPHGLSDGGHCCGGTTAHVFTDDELDCLHACGLHALSLKSSPLPQTGCAFRGPTGCILSPGDRPNICARYLCRHLIEELKVRGDLPRIEGLCDEMERTFLQYRNERDVRAEERALSEAEEAFSKSR